MRIVRYIALLFFALLWVVGCNPTLRKAAYQMGLFEDSYRYGDLYRFANLKQFKQRTQSCPKIYTDTTQKGATNLYLIGDSFTEPQRISSDDFVAKNYKRIHWNESLTIKLDTTKQNILILQTVERHFREHFAVPVDMIRLQDNTAMKVATPATQDYWEEFRAMLKKSEEALSGFLFSSDFFLTFKEWKAALNLYFFNRTDDQVAISPDKKNLLFVWDTDSTRITSSFKYLPQNELDTLVEKLNKTQEHYLALGFDKVYLAIIPNKTSIVAPNMGTYNHLVERAEKHPKLQVPVISCWQYFNNHRHNVYALGDTHWTCQGQLYWVGEVNKRLK